MKFRRSVEASVSNLVVCSKCKHKAEIMNPSASWLCPSCGTVNNDDTVVENTKETPNA
jgi:predicted RNA-binding Zn-ribbon protein involved in translation (DUF1610 family)